MANADFSQNKKQAAPGGFDEGSYREKAKPEQAVTLTPRQQKLAALEAKLPAALSTRAAALALSVVVMLAAFFGFGSAKLRGKYNTARQWFTAGVAAVTKDTKDEDPIASPTPIVILSKYNYGGSSVAAGSSTNVSFSFTNTSKTIKIENVMVTVTGGQGTGRCL